MGNLRKSLNYYCQTVTVPSKKQTTTGGIVNVGSAYKYATGKCIQSNKWFVYLEINIQGISLRGGWNVLEIQIITNIMIFIVSPRISIYKWEI